MNVSFSTIDPYYARKYLWSDSYAYLNEQVKNYVMENLGDIRVQDPLMYPKPVLEMTTKEHYDRIMELAVEKKTPAAERKEE